jgi:DNA replication protein DnaC
MKTEKAEAVKERLEAQLRELRLPTIRSSCEAIARQAEQETLSYERYLLNLCDQECQERWRRKIERLLQESCLPLEKTFATFDLKRLPTKVARQVQSLREGDFVDRKENLLGFGKPGSGKTHLLCALAHDLVQQGRRVRFTTCSLLVEGLLAAKRDLKLSRALKRWASYEVLLIDDLGYVQQDRAEMEVLFTLLADRYERGSVWLTSNLPFSKGEAIFKDPMTTAAAIDRLVHHSVIVELNLPSYRLEHAKQAKEDAASA